MKYMSSQSLEGAKESDDIYCLVIQIIACRLLIGAHRGLSAAYSPYIVRRRKLTDIGMRK